MYRTFECRPNMFEEWECDITNVLFKRLTWKCRFLNFKKGSGWNCLRCKLKTVLYIHKCVFLKKTPTFPSFNFHSKIFLIISFLIFPCKSDFFFIINLSIRRIKHAFFPYYLLKVFLSLRTSLLSRAVPYSPYSPLPSSIL